MTICNENSLIKHHRKHTKINKLCESYYNPKSLIKTAYNNIKLKTNNLKTTSRITIKNLTTVTKSLMNNLLTYNKSKNIRQTHHHLPTFCATKNIKCL